jgi:hypothetical protein
MNEAVSNQWQTSYKNTTGKSEFFEKNKPWIEQLCEKCKISISKILPNSEVSLPTKERLKREGYASTSDNPAGTFGKDIETMKQKFKEQIRLSIEPSYSIKELDANNQDQMKEVLNLRNNVVLLGVDVMVASLEEMKKLNPQEIPRHGRHMIDIYAGLQSPMISEDNLKLLTESNPPMVISTKENEHVVGTYLYTTQISSKENEPTPQEKSIFGEKGIHGLINGKIVPHTDTEEDALKTAQKALKQHNLAYFATVCVANHARGSSIGTVLKQKTYKKAFNEVMSNRDKRLKNSPAYGFQRYFSIAGIYDSKQREIHSFSPPIGNSASAALNQGTFQHMGSERMYRRVIDMTNASFEQEDAINLLKKLGIPPEEAGNYYVGIDNLYVLLDLQQAEQEFERKMEKKGLSDIFGDSK